MPDEPITMTVSLYDRNGLVATREIPVNQDHQFFVHTFSKDDALRLRIARDPELSTSNLSGISFWIWDEIQDLLSDV